MRQSRGQQGIKQGLFVPIGAGMQFVVRAPVLLVTTQTGQNAGQGRRADHQQRAHRLAHSTLKAPLLPEHRSPEREEGEKAGE
jgi:hypothetical protein